MSAPAAGPPRRFPSRRYVVAAILIALIAVSPFIPVTIGGILAGSFGCRVDEGSIHPCLVGGEDWGPTLYTLGMTGWLFLATVPVAMLLGIVWLIVLVVHLNAFEAHKGRAR